MDGMILGRFMPLHKGHCYLIDFALSMCDTVHICICSRKDEAIEGKLRFQWLREQFPTAKIYHITKEIPEAHAASPDAPRIWAEEIKKSIPEEIGYLFASEDYGWEFAKHLHAIFVPVDFARHNIPISATEIRKAPLKHWNFLSAPVQRHVMALVGVKGDKQLIQRLAETMQTRCVYPYPSRNLKDLRGTLTEREIHGLVRSEISAMHNFGCAVLLMVLDSNKEEAVYEESHCRKTFSITKQEEYEQALSYCRGLLESSWETLSAPASAAR